MAWRLGHSDVARDDGPEDSLGEFGSDFGLDLGCEIGGRVNHGKEDAADFEGRVMVFGLTDCSEKLDQALKRIVFALDRHYDGG